MSSHRVFVCQAVLALAAATALSFPAFGEELRVVATIKPVHSLVAAIMQGAGEPHLLIRGSASPHTYTMRPSDSRALQEADAVFWVGPQLETFLVSRLAALDSRARRVTLMDQDGIAVLPAREAGAWDTHHDHQAESVPAGHSKGETTQHVGDRLDPHIWLDPDNGREIARIVAYELGALDPPNRPLYERNGKTVIATIKRADDMIREMLAPVRDIPYFVFHDAYQMFERHYELSAAGSITVSPQRKPGARRLREVREKIRTLGARCLFHEPQFEPKLLNTVVEGSAVRIGVLDPLGVGIPAGPQAYPRLLGNLANSLLECFGSDTSSTIRPYPQARSEAVHSGFSKIAVSESFRQYAWQAVWLCARHNSNHCPGGGHAPGARQSGDVRAYERHPPEGRNRNGMAGSRAHRPQQRPLP